MKKNYTFSFQKIVFSIFFTLASLVMWGQTTELLISEYGEGSTGNSKYIELYNGTGNTVDLSNYRIRTGVNGKALSTTLTFSSTNITNGSTYVIANNTTDVPGANLTWSGATWNGNDAIALEKNISGTWTLIDVIGTIGSDPGTGWAVAGTANATVGRRLTRKSSVCSPNTNWSISAGTNTTNSEWTVSGTYTTGAAIAGHTASCAPICTPPSTPNGTISGTTPACTSAALTYTHGSGQPESNIEYYWQTSASGMSLANNVSAPYSTSSANNYVRAYNPATSCWSAATANYPVVINSPINITAHPSNTSVIAGNPASFSITETGGTSYQWQVDTGSGFGNIGGATSSSYSTGTTTIGMNGYQYRVIVTNACGNVTSNTATLTVTVGLSNDHCIGATALTVNAAATAGTLVGSTPQSGFTQNDAWYSFTPSCTGDHIITVSDFSGATDVDFAVYATSCPASSSTTAYRTSATSNNPETNTFSYTSGTTYLIRVFKFNVTDGDTSFNIRITSATLGTSTNITANPTTFCAGGTVTFTATTVANATNYVWTVPAGWTMTSSSTNSMTAVVGSTAGAVTAKAVNCYGEGIAKSQTFTPGVIPVMPGVITGNATTCEGESNIYSVATVSGATSYTWTLPSGWSGTSTTNSITVTAGATGGSISVTANNSCGSSAAQTLNVTVNPAPVAPSVPTSDNAACGTITLTRGNPSAGEIWYWQGNDANGKSEANSATTYSATSSGTYYIRSKNTATGCWSVASGVLVTVNSAASITTQPSNQTATTGSAATFTVIASGTGLGYQWQVDTGSGFNNVTDGSGANSAVYTTPNTTLAMNGYKYRVVITGTCGNITSDGNATLNVVNINYVNGDYRSINDGNWHGTATSGSTNTWEQLQSGVWTTISNSPPSNALSLGTSKVYIKNNITLVGNNTAPYVVVLQNGILTSNVTVTFGNLLVKSGGEFYRMNNATGMNSAGVFEIEDGGYAYITQTNTNVPTIWAGEERFHPNSNIVIKRLDAENIISASNTITPFTDGNGNSAYFGNLIIDSSVDMSIMDGVNATATRITNGDLILRTGRTGTSSFVFAKGTGTSTYAIPYVIGGNFIIESTFPGTASLRSSATTTYVKVVKDFITNGDITFRMGTSTSSVYLLVDGNINIKDTSKFYFLNTNTNTIYYISLKGDITVENGAVFTNTNAVSGAQNSVLYFTGNGDGLTPETTQTIDIAPTTGSNRRIDFNLKWPAYASTPYVMLAKNLNLESFSSVNVRGNTTLDFGFNGTTALNVTGNSGGQAFTAESGSTLKITSPDGITTTADVGNVRVPVASRTFNSGATYHYIGKVHQTTGNGLPSELSSKVIADLQTNNAPANDDLNLFINGMKYFTSTGELEIKRGTVLDMPSNGFADVSDEDGKLTMSGGRYKISRGGTQPSLGGDYSLTGGVVEFTGGSAISIRTGANANPKQYFNIDVSGSNVEAGGKNLRVNNLTKITGTGKLTIPETVDTATPYVLTAKRGIQVDADATALFANNANLMQDADAGVANSGNVKAERKASMKKMDYTYWSSPVFGDASIGQRLLNTTNPNLETSTGGFSPGTPNNRIFRYNEPNDYFYATEDNFFIPGKGYAIRGKNRYGTTKTPDTFSFTGVPNNGDAITVSVQRSPNNAFNHGYNLIGNPYPSGLDFEEFVEANNTSIKGTVWFWSNLDDNLTQSGSTNSKHNNYAVLTLAGGSPPTTGAGGLAEYTPTENIKVGQGFIVQVRDDLTPATGATAITRTLTFNNDMRTTGVGVFFNNFVKQTQVKNRYWLSFVSPDNIVNTILLAHLAGATDNYDQDYDAELLTVGDDSFYSFLGENKMQIQAKGVFLQDSKINIGTKQNRTGIYTIKLEHPEGIFANGQVIYLHDKLNNSYTNLSEQSYAFSVAKGSTENRFEIVYKQDATLATANNVKNNLQVYRNGENFIIKSFQKKIDEIEVYDASGRLYQKLEGSNKEFTINGNILISGIYILKVKRGGETISKKILK